MKCEYCIGDNDGFVSQIPKEKGKGNAYVINSLWSGGMLKVSAPFHNEITYRINYCPMCGKKLVIRGE